MTTKVKPPKGNEKRDSMGRPPKDPNAPKKEPKEKVERRNFTEVCDRAMVNADGKLNQGVVPLGDGQPTVFNKREHNPLKRENFADEADFLEFKAHLYREAGEEALQKASRFAEEAENFRKFGDPIKRARIKRLTAMRERMAELEAQLKAEGIEI